jgi:formate/nitrite transporter FocA (FNT family)
MSKASEAAQDKGRRSAKDIFSLVKESAEEELNRTSLELATSGLAGGLVMGLTPLAVVAIKAYIGEGKVQVLIAFLGYPLGFIVVIVGRMQLFTENTLHPVVYCLSERKRLPDLFRLWTAVWVANVIGAFLFALLAMKTPALHSEFTAGLARLGTAGVQGTFSQLFWGAVFAGWLVALAAWMVAASHWTIGQIVSIWLITLPIALLKLPHCIAGSGEIFSAILAGSVSFSQYAGWMLAATLGNIAGGVLMVASLNWVQADGASV